MLSTITIKNFIFFSLFIFLLPATSISRVDLKNQNLLGSWKLAAYTEHGASTTIIDGNKNRIEFDAVANNIEATLHFGEGTDNFMSSGIFTLVTTFKMLGETQSNEILYDNFWGNGSWQLHGNVITVSQNGIKRTLEVVEFSNNEIKIKGTYKVRNIPQDIEGYEDISLEMTLVR